MSRIEKRDQPSEFSTIAQLAARYLTSKRQVRRWIEAGAFKAIPDGREEPYVVMMPLPNVTGALHLGHAMALHSIGIDMEHPGGDQPVGTAHRHNQVHWRSEGRVRQSGIRGWFADYWITGSPAAHWPIA